MEHYSRLGSETIYQEFKESVLSTSNTRANPAMLDSLLAGNLTDEYSELILDQIIFDLYRYMPRYTACFFNSQRKRHSNWYYGVTDDGLAVGIPVLNKQLESFRTVVTNTFNFLRDNRVAIVIPKSTLDAHCKLEKCLEQHRLINYLDEYGWSQGYTCERFQRELRGLVKFQVVPLIKPVTPSPTTDTKEPLITRLPELLKQNQSNLDKFDLANQAYQRKYHQWLIDINYYSSKVDTLLSNPETVKKFHEFTKDFNFTPDHNCLVERYGECFRVGDRLIRDPPFMDLFRDFRDYHRDQIRTSKPKAPVPPKDFRTVAVNRLAYSGALIRHSSEITFVILKMTLRAFKAKSPNRTIFYNGHFWQYQQRSTRLESGLTPVPECKT